MLRLLLALVFLVALGSPTSGASAKSYTLAVPAAPLSKALVEVSRVTGLEFAFSDPGVAGLRSRAVSGQYRLTELLDAMMKGTGADYRFVTATTVLISRRTRPAPAPPSKQTLSSEPLLTQTIVVSASRREELMSNAPVSSAAYSQIALDQRGIEDMRALARVTPGVLFRNAWGGSTNLSIRGIYSNTGSATTGVYIDDTPIQTRSLGAGVTSTNVYPALFDLERVEVLRGPQGALFGSGSEGGTIRFITRMPDLQTSSASAAAEIMTTRGGSAGYEASAAVGMPLVEDRVAVRIAAFGRRDGGWIDRVDYPGGAPVTDSSNSLTSFAVRGAITARLSDAVTITPSIFYQRWAQHDTDQFWSLLSDIDAGVYRTGSRIPQPSRDTFLLASLKLSAELSGMTLQSTTSFFRRRRPSSVDYTDYLTEMFSRGTIFSVASVPDYEVEASFANNQDVLTQELRLVGDDAAPVRWVGGLFVQRARQDALEHIHEPLLDEAIRAITGQTTREYFGSDMLPGGISYIGEDRSTDWQIALYGQADVPLTAALDLNLGGRVAWMHYRQTNFQGGPQSGDIPPSVIAHGEVPLLPRFGLNWRPGAGRLFYLSVAKGARIGGGNAPVSSKRCGPQLSALGLTQVPARFESDSIWNYELGAKLALPGLRGSLHANAYHYRWDDIQQSYSLRCLFRYTGNNSNARGNGVEMMLDLAPLPGFTISLAGSHTRARYVGTTYGGIIDQITGERAVVIPTGQALPAPQWRLSGVLRYQWSLSDDFAAYVVGSGDHASSYEQSYAPGAVDYDAATFVSPSVTTFRLQAGLRRGRWEASLYAENLLDSRDVIQLTHNSRISANMRYVIVRPRTFGLRLSYAFD